METSEGTIAGMANVIWEGLLKLQRIIMLAAIVVTTTGIMIEAVMRFVFNSSIVGVQELAAYTALWLYFSGAAYGTYARGHVTADLSHLVIKSVHKLVVLKFITNLISFGLLVYILPWGWRYLEWGLTRHEKSSSTFMGRNYEIVFFQTSILYGIALMAFYFLVNAIILFPAVIKKQEATPAMLSEREEANTWI